MATLATLASVSKLVPTITVVGLFDFIFIAKQLRDDVLLAQPAEESEADAPEILPPTMTRLFASACSIQFGEVEMLWAELLVLSGTAATGSTVLPTHLPGAVLSWEALGLAAGKAAICR